MDTFKTTTYHYPDRTSRFAREKHNLTSKDERHVPKCTQVRVRRYVDLQKRARATRPTAGWVKTRDVPTELDEASRVSMAAETVTLNFSSFANVRRPERSRPLEISSRDPPEYPKAVSRSNAPELSRSPRWWQAYPYTSPYRLKRVNKVFSAYSDQREDLLPSGPYHKARLAEAAELRNASAVLEKPSPFGMLLQSSMSPPHYFYTQPTSGNIETLCEPETESENESFDNFRSKLLYPLLHETHSDSSTSATLSKAIDSESNFDTRYGYVYSQPVRFMHADSDSAQSEPNQDVENPTGYTRSTTWYYSRVRTFANQSASSNDSDEWLPDSSRLVREMRRLLEKLYRHEDRKKSPPKEARPVPLDYLELDPWVPFPCGRLLLQPQPQQRELSFNPISTQRDSRDLPEGYRDVNSWPVNSIGHTSICTWKASAGRSKSWTVFAYLQHRAKGYEGNTRPHDAILHQLQCQIIRRTQTRSLRYSDTRSDLERKFTARSHLARTQKKELYRKAYGDYSQLEASEDSDTENFTHEYSQKTLDDLTEPPKRILRLKIHNGMAQHDISHGVIFKEGQSLDFQYSLGVFLQFDNHSDVYLAHDNRNETMILHAHVFLSEALPGNWNTFVKRKMKRMRNNSSFVKDLKLAGRPVIIQEVTKFEGTAPFEIKSMDAEFPPLPVAVNMCSQGVSASFSSAQPICGEDSKRRFRMRRAARQRDARRTLRSQVDFDLNFAMVAKSVDLFRVEEKKKLVGAFLYDLWDDMV